MYAYIKGVLADVEEESVVVEAGGIGYRIYTTGQTFDYLPAVGEEVKLYTYLNVRCWQHCATNASCISL